jgi:hypothetical protein
MLLRAPSRHIEFIPPNKDAALYLATSLSEVSSIAASLHVVV